MNLSISTRIAFKCQTVNKLTGRNSGYVDGIPKR